ncbi:MAG: aromatic amino acid lyase [Planctomycetes bacterium]|nr:aromatic amino acid lyase [Planctomycetota bacterium]
MTESSGIERVVLTGHDLTIEEVVAVARRRVPVSLAAPARRRVRCCRRMVDVLLQRGEKVYGLTTGFGKLRDVRIANKDVERLQMNLIRSHAVGVGAPFDEDVVRAAMLLRANTLARGNSGIRLETLEALVALLNDGIYPYVPQQGSVGCSGDLAPLSHLALVVTGDPGGRVLPRHARRDGAAPVTRPRPDEFVACGEVAWAEAALTAAPTFRPVTLGAKEGLALNNGTQFMTAVACLALHDAGVCMSWAELAVAMSLEAQRGVRGAFRPELHAARDLSHQAATAARILARTEGSEVLDVLLNTASLRRVRSSLAEVRDHLAPFEPTPGLEEVRRALTALEADVRALVPDGGPAPAAILTLRGAPARAQIEGYQELLTPIRVRATAVLQRLDAPDVPSPPLARDALVRALADLSHAIPAAPPVQDDYSLRCAPQVLACAHRALAHVREVVAVEVNAATDNPLLFPPEPPGGFDAVDDADYARWLAEPARAAGLADLVIGGGNFHGEPIAKVMDYFAIAMSEVASIAERRVAHLVDAALSNGLPPFLMESSGLNSGFMLPQYTAAALVSENKVLCHPASVDSIPTCAGSEDHVSMGMTAARKAATVLDNVVQVVAIEVLAAYQALSFRAPLRPGRGVTAAARHLRDAGVEVRLDDGVLYPAMHHVRELLRSPPPG